MKIRKNIIRVLCAALAAFAQVISAGAAGLPDGGPTFGGMVEFDRVVYDFGDILVSDGPVTAVFTAKNIGSKPFVIYNVVSSCGCTGVEWTKEPVKPGATATVKATYSNDEKPLPFDKSITVYVSGLKNPVILRLKGESHDKKVSLAESYPVRFGNLAFKTAEIKGGNMSQGESKSGEVLVANIGSKPIKVSFKDVSPNLSLRIIPGTIPAGSTARLDFTVKSDPSLWGKNYYFATPLVDGQPRKAVVASSNGQPEPGGEAIVADGNPELGQGQEKIGIYAITKANFSSLTEEEKKKGSEPYFNGSSFSFGKIPAGRVIESYFEFTNKGKSDFKIYKVDTETSAVTVKPLPDVAPGASAQLEFKLDSSKMPKGEVLVVLSLYTNSPIRPIVNLFLAGWIE